MMELVRNLMNDFGHIVKRINYFGRIYIRQHPEFKYYSGLTGAMGKAEYAGNKDKRRIRSWRDMMLNSFGEKLTDGYVEATADFGTLLHESLVDIWSKGKIEWPAQKEKAEAVFLVTFEKNNLPYDKSTHHQMVYDYCKHVASLQQFIYDRVNDIYAVETPCFWEDANICTPVDIYCNCRPTPKADHEPMVINVKTSGSINKGHLEQVAIEKHMWNMTYEENQATKAAIIRTKDWREDKAPTYEFKVADDPENLIVRKWEYKFKGCLADSDATYYPTKEVKVFDGESQLGDAPEIKILSLEEAFKQGLLWEGKEEDGTR